MSVPAVSVETNELQTERPAASRLRGLWRLATANTKVTIGLVIVLFFVLLALLGPLFVRTDPSAFGQAVSVSPSGAHLLGTTSYGQDVLDQVIVGVARV